MTIIEVINGRLCIGCGFCAGVCPQSCISMTWSKSAIWLPVVDMGKCNDCGLCLQVCPNSIKALETSGRNSIHAGYNYGLKDKKDNKYYISYASAIENRLSSASGGSTTKLLCHLIEQGEVDFIVAVKRRMAKIGEPHFETVICRTVEDIKACSSSAYGPLRYDLALREIADKRENCAITVLPCIQRAFNNLPDTWRKYIRFTFGIVCSHNVTDQFGDFMAYRHGISQKEYFSIDYRDKKGIPDANHFNTCFKLNNGREIRTSRMENGFTPAWRNYWFAHESCLYCPDFFNAEADISIKDAWGPLSNDPCGISLCIVRNDEIKKALNELKSKGSIHLEECDSKTIRDSQSSTVMYKQVDFIHRWKQHPALQETAETLSSQTAESNSAIKDYRRKLRNIRLTRSILQGSSYPRYLLLAFIAIILQFQSKLEFGLIKYFGIIARLFRSFASYCSLLTKWGIAPRSHDSQSLRILITGGYGNQNVGDEAQLGANIRRWKKLLPKCEIQAFSPNPEYTEQRHNVKSIRAPRVIWFHADRNADYSTSNLRFQRRYFQVKFRMVISTQLMRIGLPALFCKPSEYALLNELMRADVLHVSGGGFLTGMTRSRLWENCLLMRICYLIGTPVILTGQTIGVFKSKIDRKLAKLGLEHAELIYLRDNENSEEDVKSLGIKGDHVRSTFDDALFCEKANSSEIDDALLHSGIDIDQPFIAANYHYWGQSDDMKIKSTLRFAELCNLLIKLTDIQILFIPMHPSDESPEQSVINNIHQKANLLKYKYDYRIARGVIGRAKLMITMKHHPIIFSYGEGVPVISISLDDYYYRKNKGAMDLCGQTDYCMDIDTFMNKHAFTVLDNMINNITSNQTKITNWLNIARKQVHGVDIYLKKQGLC